MGGILQNCQRHFCVLEFEVGKNQRFRTKPVLNYPKLCLFTGIFLFKPTLLVIITTLLQHEDHSS